MEDDAERLKRQIEKWRDELVDLTRRNRALNFPAKSGPSVLHILEPSAQGILDGLQGSPGWRFHYPPLNDEEADDGVFEVAILTADPVLTDERESDELLTDVQVARQLDNAVRNLERRAAQEYMDKGLRVLYLALGMVSWTDEARDTWRSPVLFVPVQLSRQNPRVPFRLTATDDDTFVNPALILKLQEFGIELAEIDDEVAPVAALDDALAHLAEFDELSVERTAVLSFFSFQKEVMYRDLKDNEDRIAAHPVVRALGLGPQAAEDLGFSPISETVLDEAAPPEDMISILDADATQRACIVAARDSRSFVMDGPPGSGKSQTIANMIAELIASNKTVLFVSEKAAALEVVKQRLDRAGLGSYVLELHSHKATRKAVAEELGRALVERPVPGSVLSRSELASAKKRREELSAYAAAVNSIREPLGRSLHAVLGRIAALHSAPQLAAPNGIDGLLEPGQLNEIIEQAGVLARSWGPVTRGGEFVWRELADPSDALRRQGEIERLLQQFQTALGEVSEEARTVALELGLDRPVDQSDAAKLRDVLVHLETRRDVHRPWLTIGSIADVEACRTEASMLHKSIVGLRSALEEATGDWQAVAPESDARLAAALDRLEQLAPLPTVDVGSSVAELTARTDRLGSAVERLPTVATRADKLRTELGMAQLPLTLVATGTLADLAALAVVETPPEPSWLDRRTIAAARNALAVVEPVIAEHRATEARLTEVFKPELRDFDVEALYDNAQDVSPKLGRLSSSGRSNRKALAAYTVNGKVTKEVVAALPTARAMQYVARRLREVEKEQQGILGATYYRGEDTDLEVITAALEVAEAALKLAGRDVDYERLGQAVGRGSLDAAEVAETGASLRKDVAALTEDVVAGTGVEAEIITGLEFDALAQWARAAYEQQSSLNAALDSAAARDEWTLERARAVAAERRQLDDLLQSEATNCERFEAILGPTYSGENTDWSKLGDDLGWTMRLRSIVDRPISDAAAQRLMAAAAFENRLAKQLVRLESLQQAFLAEFADEHAATINADLGVSLENAVDLVGAFHQSLPEIEEWSSYVSAVETLEGLGMGRSVASAIEDHIAANEVVPALERAALTAWIEALLKADEAKLGSLRSIDRDELVDRFQESDAALVSHAASRVRSAANARRPTSNVGPAGVIQREGQKQRRHMPIRRLLKDTGAVAQACKPCFMMSPLSVSSFLPAELPFDVVIFDEASQVRPSDAINAVYRGQQLVIAGDDRQLPPTSFFDRVTHSGGDEFDEEELDEFESILKLARSGSLPELPLRWHYRSRHESLITYSNYSFYDGKLISFPGATADGPGLGVEFVYVPDGRYARGGARDNQIEAQKVVERVLAHAEMHPEKSLGVVAFSEAQASRVAYEIEAARRSRPDLDDYFAEDRLDGFFVKNLENVQGDERDIIIFSVGYARDEVGKFTLNFGPVNKAGGWRRLNVAVTRARERIEVVSSITAGDIGDTTSEGVRHFKRYLDYAERGVVAVHAHVVDGGLDVESPFEEEVLRVIRSWGYEVVPQVGTAGYRIDLGIRHPDQPGRYVLGVECDGAMYHSSRVARDRDRLRQQVLEGLDWRLHRIWGTSWYRHRAHEEDRLRQAISDAIADKPRRARVAAPAHELPLDLVEEFDFSAPPAWAQVYQRAAVQARSGVSITDTTAGPEIERLALKIVEIEGPLSYDDVAAGLKVAFGAKYLGASAKKRILSYLAQMVRREDLTEIEEGFLVVAGHRDLAVRTPNPAQAEIRRTHYQVPWIELELALVNIVKDSHAIGTEDLTAATARLFGWSKTADVRLTIATAIDIALKKGTLRQDGELLRIPS